MKTAPLTNQKGIAHILILMAALGLIAFIIISNTFNFKDGLFASIFPKPSSRASGPGIVLLDSNNQPTTQTTTASIKVELTSPWAIADAGFSLIKEAHAQTVKGNRGGNKKSPNPSPTTVPTSTPGAGNFSPTPFPTATPAPKIASAIIAEDVNFTQNVVNVSPFSSNPMVVNYTLSSVGSKTIYALFTSNTGQTQIFQASINFVTSSPVPSPTLVPTPAPTAPPATGSTSLEYGTWVPTAYDTCTKAIHDSYFVIGDDGKKYSTWHPAIDPVTGCSFGHEHGADPRTSKANSTMPAFGYAAEQAGMAEAHAGFKVMVLSAGETVESNVANKISTLDARVVIHQGTSGVKRYVTQMHSMQYDYIWQDGSGAYAHVNGLADTGNGTGSTCGSDGSTTAIQSPRDGGKDFATVDCSDPYEIWNNVNFVIHGPGEFTDRLNARASLSTTWGVFDPITTRDWHDNTRLLYSHTYFGKDPLVSPTSPQGFFQGCDREDYFTGEINNIGKPSIVYTDPYGLVLSTTPSPGLIRQEIANVVSRPTDIFKKRVNFCGNGIHAPN